MWSLDQARDSLRALRHTIVWYGQTHILCRGLENLCDDFLVVPTTLAGRALCDTAGLPWKTPAAFETYARTASHPITILCYEEDGFLAGLRGPGRYVLRPAADIVLGVADKTALSSILAAASAPAIPHSVLPSADPEEVPSLVHRLGGQSWVVQMPPNNLTGRGTLLGASPRELARILIEHRGMRLKVARFIDGISVTISGCVHPGGTVISYLSRQVVGEPALTSHWAAHCGNDIALPGGLKDDTVLEIRSIARRVGDVLRTKGFVGCFGLDLILDETGVPYVLEINPRFQSVSSTGIAGEMARGYFPLAVWHILSFHQPELVPPGLVDEEHMFSSFAQVIMEYQGAPRAITRSLLPGRYTAGDSHGTTAARGRRWVRCHGWIGGNSPLRGR